MSIAKFVYQGFGFEKHVSKLYAIGFFLLSSLRELLTYISIASLTMKLLFKCPQCTSEKIVGHCWIMSGCEINFDKINKADREYFMKVVLLYMKF